MSRVSAWVAAVDRLAPARFQSRLESDLASDSKSIGLEVDHIVPPAASETVEPAAIRSRIVHIVPSMRFRRPERVGSGDGAGTRSQGDHLQLGLDARAVPRRLRPRRHVPRPPALAAAERTGQPPRGRRLGPVARPRLRPRGRPDPAVRGRRAARERGASHVWPPASLPLSGPRRNLRGTGGSRPLGALTGGTVRHRAPQRQGTPRSS